MSRRLIDPKQAYEIARLGYSDFALSLADLTSLREVLEDCDTIDAVELPCKIGDKVWVSRRYKCHKRPRWGIVSEMFFTEDMELCIVVKGVARGKWGVDVFATYEEAQAEIERRDKNGMS
jgi:hypothetical protein